LRVVKVGVMAELMAAACMFQNARLAALLIPTARADVVCATQALSAVQTTSASQVMNRI